MSQPKPEPDRGAQPVANGGPEPQPSPPDRNSVMVGRFEMFGAIASGGFAAIHSACASEREWPWYWALVGGRFVRHPPMQKFVIKVIDRSHPSTAFLGETWPWEDECYYLDHYNPDIRILLAADLTTVEDPERGTYPGVVFGDYSPLAWFHEFEGSRQFFTALGHKIEHYSDPMFRRHLQAGLLWVMKKD